MTTMTYPPYDGFSRSISRRQSIAYGGTPMPYSPQGLYTDPMIHQTLGEYPQPSYQIYGPPANTIPVSHRLTGPSYDDLDIHDGYYLDDRRLSSGHLPMVPHSNMGLTRPRHRRHSTVSFASRPTTMDIYRRPSSINIKFKRKGGFIAGISLREAQDHVRLSGNDSYRTHDFHADSRNRILLRIKWAGYTSMTYEIPLDGYDGRVSLQTLARRVSRACVHYLQANVIPIVWDRVHLHHLEEVAYGIWQPMLSAH